jgi:hypothetical protein
MPVQACTSLYKGLQATRTKTDVGIPILAEVAYGSGTYLQKLDLLTSLAGT